MLFKFAGAKFYAVKSIYRKIVVFFIKRTDFNSVTVCFFLQTKDNHLDLKYVISQLYEMQIFSVMVEAGGAFDDSLLVVVEINQRIIIPPVEIRLEQFILNEAVFFKFGFGI